MDSQIDELHIFSAAVEIDDPAARSAFLAEVCKNDLSLQERLERLISAHVSSLSVLDDFSLNSTKREFDNKTLFSTNEGMVEPAVLESGTVLVGRYTLVERIGHGGMGEVWVAQQTEPVKRRVAIKLIIAGMNSRQVLGRFDSERQALALMEHPNIAKIYDGGTTETGRPFFVMELVQGVMVTNYCDQLEMTVRERLVLFRQICSAVQHAHQKGLIHRDLKPSNILVAEFDGKPICKVIDFGLAKAMQGTQSLSEIAMQTVFGALIGTPMYMAPEQLRANHQDIDTRADLYSLGVLLYELLTGSTPIERDHLNKVAWDEILRMIREENPPTPSQRLSGSKSLAQVAQMRFTDPLRLTKLVKGELDWITMKALEKDRSRRYESAGELGLEIQRYLAGESVLAAPPSRFYNVCKWAARNRGLAYTGVLLLLSLLAGILGTSYGLYNAGVSAVAENTAKTDALNKQKEAELQRNRAEMRERQAINAVKRFGDVVRENPELRNNPSLGGLRKSLLQGPLVFFKTLRSDLEKENNDQLKALEKLAGIAFDQGQLIEEIGSKDDAIEAYRQSQAIRNRILTFNPSSVALRNDLSATHGRIAALYLAMGQNQMAIKENQLAIEPLQKITQETPDDHTPRRNLGGFYNNQGNIHQQVGDTQSAATAFQKAIDIGERLVADAPLNKTYQSDVIKYRYNLAIVFAYHGQFDRALEVSKTCLSQAESLLETAPESNEYEVILATVLGGTGTWTSEAKGIEHAIPIQLREAQICEKLAIKNPSNQAFQSELARCYFGLGRAYNLLSKIDKALEFIEKSIEIGKKSVGENPGDLEYQSTLAMAFKERGDLFLKAGKWEDAKKHYRMALNIRENIVRLSPGAMENQIGLALSYLSLGNLPSASDRQSRLEAFDKSISVLEKLLQIHPEIVELHRWLATVLDYLAMFEIELQELDSARAHLLQAETHIKTALAASPTAEQFLTVLRSVYSNMMRLGDPALTNRVLVEIVEITKKGPDATQLESKLHRVVTQYSDEPISELLAIAAHGYNTHRNRAACRIYEMTIEKFPEVLNDRRLQVGYNAACCAALAASENNDQEPLDDPTKEQWNRQALDWLRAELGKWKDYLDAAQPKSREEVVAVLNHWKSDSDLASLRDPVRLEQRTEREQQACLALWNDVEELLQIASQDKSQSQN